MVLVWIGALLILAGVLFMAAQPLLHGRLSGGKRFRSGLASDTLEPAKPTVGFGMKSNWPGFALVAIGAVLLLAGTAF